MARRVEHLLIGGGVAAASCASQLREEGADGSILIVGRELDPPYHRPPLSKAYLGGSEARDAALFRPGEWWAGREIELLTRTSVMKLDAAARVATLSTKEEVEFGSALIATGANVRRLRAEGSELEGIHYLRAYGNADAIRADAKGAARAVVIGGSYLGTEVAATLRGALGLDCSIVMQEGVTLERPYGPLIGGHFQRVLEEHGVRVHGGQELERFEGTDGRVRRVVTAAGLELECDLVVIGAGVMPDVTLARAAGLDIGSSGGVRCSAGLETSAPGIYAAGDMCEFESALHGRRVRVEHSDVALEQGRTVAHNMLGRRREHTAEPYFYSHLHDWASAESLGVGSGEPLLRGSLEDGEFSAFYLDHGRVTGALSVGRPQDLEHARRLIAGRAGPEPALLADPASDLAVL
ncbi:MAG TPA: FAD-dependent oxidoreductase [Thermoleophilaceae bacterium]|nr:FAD-dependent oxidoreductase [Thermoleophilaceae bacterium]